MYFFRERRKEKGERRKEKGERRNRADREKERADRNISLPQSHAQELFCYSRA